MAMPIITHEFGANQTINKDNVLEALRKQPKEALEELISTMLEEKRKSTPLSPLTNEEVISQLIAKVFVNNTDKHNQISSLLTYNENEGKKILIGELKIEELISSAQNKMEEARKKRDEQIANEAIERALQATDYDEPKQTKSPTKEETAIANEAIRKLTNTAHPDHQKNSTLKKELTDWLESKISSLMTQALRTSKKPTNRTEPLKKTKDESSEMEMESAPPRSMPPSQTTQTPPETVATISQTLTPAEEKILSFRIAKLMMNKQVIKNIAGPESIREYLKGFITSQEQQAILANTSVNTVESIPLEIFQLVIERIRNQTVRETYEELSPPEITAAILEEIFNTPTEVEQTLETKPVEETNQPAEKPGESAVENTPPLDPKPVTETEKSDPKTAQKSAERSSTQQLSVSADPQPSRETTNTGTQAGRQATPTQAAPLKLIDAVKTTIMSDLIDKQQELSEPPTSLGGYIRKQESNATKLHGSSYGRSDEIKKLELAREIKTQVEKANSAADQLIIIREAIRKNKNLTGAFATKGNLHKILSKMEEEVLKTLNQHPRDKLIAELRDYIKITQEEEAVRTWDKSGKVRTNLEEKRKIARNILDPLFNQESNSPKQTEAIYKRVLESNAFKGALQAMIEKNTRITKPTSVGSRLGKILKNLLENTHPDPKSTPKGS